MLDHRSYAFTLLSFDNFNAGINKSFDLTHKNIGGFEQTERSIGCTIEITDAPRNAEDIARIRIIVKYLDLSVPFLNDRKRVASNGKRHKSVGLTGLIYSVSVNLVIDTRKEEFEKCYGFNKI